MPALLAGDMRSLCQQLSYSYSANKRVAAPLHMHLLGFKGPIQELAQKLVAGRCCVFCLAALICCFAVSALGKEVRPSDATPCATKTAWAAHITTGLLSKLCWVLGAGRVQAFPTGLPRGRRRQWPSTLRGGWMRWGCACAAVLAAGQPVVCVPAFVLQWPHMCFCICHLLGHLLGPKRIGWLPWLSPSCCCCCSC